jgi:hypothetical protein
MDRPFSVYRALICASVKGAGGLIDGASVDGGVSPVSGGMVLIAEVPAACGPMDVQENKPDKSIKIRRIALNSLK